MPAFQYVAYVEPSDKEKEEGVGGKILIPTDTVWAESPEHVNLIAARKISEDDVKQYGARIKVAVRSF